MPKFYFHLRDDLCADDPEGTELPHLEAARAQAEKYALDMAAASVLENRLIKLHHRIEVATESGETVLSVSFGDVLRVEA